MIKIIMCLSVVLILTTCVITVTLMFKYQVSVEHHEALSSTGCIADNLYPDQMDCSRFYMCGPYGLQLFNCPLGMHFNHSANSCDWSEVAGCIEVTTQEVLYISTTKELLDDTDDDLNSDVLAVPEFIDEGDTVIDTEVIEMAEQLSEETTEEVVVTEEGASLANTNIGDDLSTYSFSYNEIYSTKTDEPNVSVAGISSGIEEFVDNSTLTVEKQTLSIATNRKENYSDTSKTVQPVTNMFSINIFTAMNYQSENPNPVITNSEVRSTSNNIKSDNEVTMSNSFIPVAVTTENIINENLQSVVNTEEPSLALGSTVSSYTDTILVNQEVFDNQIQPNEYASSVLQFSDINILKSSETTTNILEDTTILVQPESDSTLATKHTFTSTDTEYLIANEGFTVAVDLSTADTVSASTTLNEKIEENSSSIKQYITKTTVNTMVNQYVPSEFQDWLSTRKPLTVNDKLTTPITETSLTNETTVVTTERDDSLTSKSTAIVTNEEFAQGISSASPSTTFGGATKDATVEIHPLQNSSMFSTQNTTSDDTNYSSTGSIVLQANVETALPLNGQFLQTTEESGVELITSISTKDTVTASNSNYKDSSKGHEIFTAETSSKESTFVVDEANAISTAEVSPTTPKSLVTTDKIVGDIKTSAANDVTLLDGIYTASYSEMVSTSNPETISRPSTDSAQESYVTDGLVSYINTAGSNISLLEILSNPSVVSSSIPIEIEAEFANKVSKVSTDNTEHNTEIASLLEVASPSHLYTRAEMKDVSSTEQTTQNLNYETVLHTAFVNTDVLEDTINTVATLTSNNLVTTEEIFVVSEQGFTSELYELETTSRNHGSNIQINSTSGVPITQSVSSIFNEKDSYITDKLDTLENVASSTLSSTISENAVINNTVFEDLNTSVLNTDLFGNFSDLRTESSLSSIEDSNININQSATDTSHTTLTSKTSIVSIEPHNVHTEMDPSVIEEDDDIENIIGNLLDMGLETISENTFYSDDKENNEHGNNMDKDKYHHVEVDNDDDNENEEEYHNKHKHHKHHDDEDTDEEEEEEEDDDDNDDDDDDDEDEDGGDKEEGRHHNNHKYHHGKTPKGNQFKHNSNKRKHNNASHREKRNKNKNEIYIKKRKSNNYNNVSSDDRRESKNRNKHESIEVFFKIIGKFKKTVNWL